MLEANWWIRSRPLLIASALPFAVLLGTGVASAAPEADAPPPAALPAPPDWMMNGQLPAIDLPAIDAAEPLPGVDPEFVGSLCASIPVDAQRCGVTVVDAGVGAAIGAGIGVGVSAPLAIATGLVGAGLGFVAGIPFLPTGLVVGPLVGAAVGVAVVAGPAAVLGAALGASVGAIVGLTTPLPVDAPVDDGTGVSTALD
ncbi:hypothetical protein ACFRAQ_14000 [Nocardia sp. NPDC056611]|uniref:hypothetical protein n=1 Tax=Nocardia sp. NPDC056611 TaxID=3345877 RepID=UPI00367350B1